MMARVLRAIRLSYAMQRFELRFLLAVVAMVVLAALAIAWQTRAVREEQLACYRDAAPVGEGSVGSPCEDQDPMLRTLENAAAFAKVGVIATPFVLGMFLGVPLVAREVEGRTAPIAWSLSRSRRRWLLHRAAPVVAVVALASLLAGVAGEVLTRAAPWAEGVDPGFNDYGSRGGLVAVRGLAVVAVGLVMGALVPRQLPALLLAGGATLALFLALTLVMDGWMEAAAEPMAVGEGHSGEGPSGASTKIYGSGYRDDATGEILNYEEYFQAHGDAALDEFGEPIGATNVLWLVPGSRYGDFVLRESAILGSVAILSLAGAAAAVGVRRP
jgi:hypothetical protein